MAHATRSLRPRLLRHRRHGRLLHLAAASCLFVVACSDRPTPAEASDACDDLCVEGGFSGGTATAYGDGLDTCVCAGLGDGLTESACAGYCATFGVDATGAQLTTDADDDDTCTCNAGR